MIIMLEHLKRAKQIPTDKPVDEDKEKVPSEKEHDVEEETRLLSRHAEANKDLPQEEKSASAGQDRILRLFAEKVRWKRVKFFFTLHLGHLQ